MRQSKWWRNTLSLTTAQRARFKLTRSLRSLFWNQLDLPKKKKNKKKEKRFLERDVRCIAQEIRQFRLKIRKRPKITVISLLFFFVCAILTCFSYCYKSGIRYWLLWMFKTLNHSLPAFTPREHVLYICTLTSIYKS